MRIEAAASLMFLLVGLAAPPAIAQDTAGPGSRSSPCIISAISVAEHADSVDVEVAFNELVQPEVSRLEHPDRLVFDFPGCELAGPGQRFVVNRGPVLAVSSAALEVASPIARVVVELRSAQSRERAIAGHKLVVSLSSSGNNLVIELDANGGSRRPALAGGGNEPAANSLPLPPKSAAVVEPVPSAAPVVPGDDRAAPKTAGVAPMPSVSPVAVGTARAAPRTAEAVAPMPSVPPVAVGTARAAPRTAEAVAPMPSVPPVAVGTARAAPRTAEAVAPMLSLPPVGRNGASGAYVGGGGGADAKLAASRSGSNGTQVGGSGADDIERTGSSSRDRPSGAQVCGGGRRAANTKPVAASADSAHGNASVPRLCASRQSSNSNHLRSGAVGSQGGSGRSRG